jgi:hypothetical protein
MPGDKKHHTEKFRSCVEKVIASGKSEDSAYAICTTSLQEAGEPIFEAAEMHHLHLLGATGRARTEMHDGREYLVVPVVALMEGVIHAVNAANPEFVPAATLQRAAASWNGRPCVLGHPVKAGKQCSANDPAILDAHAIGKIFNSRVEGTKLLQEAWIEKAKAKRLHPDMMLLLEGGKPVEVSVGAFVLTDDKAGEYNGKRYNASWLETTGDHLAFLPGGRGACSGEMGCGAHRAAEDGHLMHLVTAEAIEPINLDLPYATFTTLEGKSLDDRIAAVNRAVDKQWGNASSGVSSFTYAMQVFDDRVIVKKDDKTFSVSYTMKNGEVVFGESTEVKQAWVAARTKMEDCPACKGSGNANGNPCEACDGEGEIRAASITTLLGARNSEKDSKIIQAVHDHAMFLGAKCERTNLKMLAAADTPQLRAACGCKGDSMSMTKEKRAELIAALVTDKYSGFKEGDEPFLETATDARLEEFKAAAETHKGDAETRTKLENDHRNAAAKLKVAEEKLKVAEEKPTKEQWLEAAPPEIKALLDRQAQQETEQRDALVKQLKGLGANTEDELKSMPIPQLQTLARYAKFEQPDFSGRGIPVPRDAGEKEDFTPPDPYAAGIKALQSKTVN